MNYSEALDVAYNKLKTITDTPRLDAKVLLKNITHQSDADLIINGNREISEKDFLCFQNDLEKRLNHVPVSYITGKKEFYGRSFSVSPSVLIPRPETETLIESVLFYIKDKKIEKPNILDLCTGSGCIGITLSLETDSEFVLMTDISKAALETAKKNASILGAKNTYFQNSSLFQSLDNRKFDIIVSNPPYVSTSQMQEVSEEVHKEPNLALEAGAEGFDIIVPLVENALNYLEKEGALFIECDYRQTARLKKMMTSSGFSKVEIIKDLSGLDRIVWGVNYE